MALKCGRFIPLKAFWSYDVYLEISARLIISVNISIYSEEWCLCRQHFRISLSAEHIFQHHILFSCVRIPSATRPYHISIAKDAPHKELFNRQAFDTPGVSWKEFSLSFSSQLRFPVQETYWNASNLYPFFSLTY